MSFSQLGHLALLAVASLAPSVDAFWRINCGTIQLGRVDPIINYDGVSGHVHIIGGPNNFNTTSNYDSLRSSLCTSCTVQEDKSAYWTPYMYYQKADGTFQSVKNGGIIIYYLGRGEGPTTPFPPGFRMLSGSPGLRAYDNSTLTYGTKDSPARPIADRVSFNCIHYDKPRPETPGFPADMNCPQGLRAQIQFPSCWDGTNLYKPDQSHVAYLSQIDNGVCPPTHPVLLPHLFYEMIYNVDSVDTSDGGRFLLATGDTTGYGYHGDFLNGWEPDVQARAVKNCLASAGSGQVEDCPDLNASNDPASNANCPLQPAIVDEQVSGSLSALPGCNPPTSGPGRATQQTCPGRIIPQNTTTDGQTRSPPVPGSTSATLSSGSKATYAGCFTDSNTRALSGASYTDATSMTTESCGAFCQGKGFSVFGTEYGQECYCGNTITSANATQSDCNMSCKGAFATYCGGPNRLSVWNIAKPGSNSSSSATTQPTSSSTSTRSSTATTTSTSAATPSIQLQDATYLGCFTDSVSPRALTGYYSNTQTQTLNTCAAAAVQNNYKYFGLEYSGECFAGNTIASSSTPNSPNCNMPCHGNKTQTCGGSSAISVFQNSKFVAASNKPTVSVTSGAKSGNYNYVGCYTDAAGNSRTLTDYSFTDSKMTVELCASTCLGRGYSWAGVEYSVECYCGGAGGVKNGAKLVADGQCSMRCGGDQTEYCGAGGMVSVYKLQGASRRRMKRRVSAHV